MCSNVVNEFLKKNYMALPLHALTDLPDGAMIDARTMKERFTSMIEVVLSVYNKFDTMDKKMDMMLDIMNSKEGKEKTRELAGKCLHHENHVYTKYCFQIVLLTIFSNIMCRQPQEENKTDNVMRFSVWNNSFGKGVQVNPVSLFVAWHDNRLDEAWERDLICWSTEQKKIEREIQEASDNGDKELVNKGKKILECSGKKKQCWKNKFLTQHQAILYMKIIVEELETGSIPEKQVSSSEINGWKELLHQMATKAMESMEGTLSITALSREWKKKNSVNKKRKLTVNGA